MSRHALPPSPVTKRADRARASGPARESNATTATDPEPARLGLQRQARHNLRGHLLRAGVRVLVLVVVDLSCFWLIREVLRTVVQAGILGTTVSHAMARVVPLAFMNGWQFACALLLSLLVLGNYGPGDRRRDVGRLVAACLIAVALPLWSEIWTEGPAVVFVQYSTMTALLGLALVAERMTIDRAVARAFPKRRVGPRTLLVGRSEDCAAMQRSPLFGNGADLSYVGFVDVTPAADSRALGTLSELSSVLRQHRIEAVIVGDRVADTVMAELADVVSAAGCELLAVPSAARIPGVQPSLVWRRGQPLIQLTTPSLRGWQLVVKRLVDVVAATGGLLVVSPLMVLLAILVKLDSGGRVFFRQVRVGQGGRLFSIIKFRTMVSNAESVRAELVGQSVYTDQRLFKVLSDPRVTRLGRILRRTSMDELPQLWNVLLGDMSLVGPRPPLPSEVTLYEARHYVRFDVKPGITGPWQVAGRNQITDFEKVIALETEYIRQWSLWRDVVILTQTLVAVLRMQGAH